MTSKNKYKAKVGNKKTTFTYLGNQFIPLFSEVTSVVAIPFTDDERLLSRTFFSDHKSYLLIYSVQVGEMFDFVATGEANERQVMNIDTFIENYHAGDTELMKQTILRAKNLTQF